MAVDPVCNMDVEPSKAAAKSSYKGKDYYFCAEMCKQKFDTDPEKYLLGAAPARQSLWAKLFKG